MSYTARFPRVFGIPTLSAFGLAPVVLPAGSTITNVSDIAPGMLQQGYSSAVINNLATYGVTAAQLLSLKNAYPPGAAFNAAAAALVSQLQSGQIAGDNVINPVAGWISTGVDTSIVTQAPVAPAVSPAVSTAVSPAVSTAVSPVAPTVATNSVLAWLSGSTAIFSYNVPNALLAGGATLLFAILLFGGKKKR